MSFSCEPSDLITGAKCILKCIPPGLQPAAQTALLDLINGGPMATNVLLQNGKEYIWRVPPRMQVPLHIYLLLVVLNGENRTVDQLLQAAKCLRCIPAGIHSPVQTYEICEWNEGGQGLCDHPVVLDWLERLAADFQPRPSDETIVAVCDFCEALDVYGIMDKMLVVNPIIWDAQMGANSFLSMRYPLIWQAANGVSPWINFNFLAADLNVGGLLGSNAPGKYFDTMFNPRTHWGLSLDSLGLSAYESEAAIGVGDETDIGCVVPATSKNMWLSCWVPSTAENFGIGWDNASAISVNIGDSPGFFSLERTTVNRIDLFRNGLSIGNDLSVQAGDVVPSASVYAMAINNSPTGPADYSTKRISFFSIHEGLTASEANDFYHAVQWLRMDLNGGWV